MLINTTILNNKRINICMSIYDFVKCFWYYFVQFFIDFILLLLLDPILLLFSFLYYSIIDRLFFSSHEGIQHGNNKSSWSFSSFLVLLSQIYSLILLQNPFI